MSSPDLRSRYLSALQKLGYESSEAQLAALERMEVLRESLLETAPRTLQGLWGRWRPVHSEPHRHGLYLWGEVGRGKTFLMDLFYDSLPFAARRRAHFHHFMAEVHAELNRVRSEQRPAEIVAQRFARRIRVLCLDELQVSDIGDAMLLHGLFAGLIDAGVTLVITSNRPPDELYKDGLQRARFLPAIALLQQQLEVHQLGGANDYRLRQLQSAPVYFVGPPAVTEPELARVYERLAGDNRDEEPALTLMGRRVIARRRVKDVVWFDFQTLCQGARSQNDYVELAVAFNTVVLSGVPVIDTGLDDAGRRFIALVDEFYDQGVKLVLSAAAQPSELYQGERLRFEFQRTASRLVEMQSTVYLARPHGR